MHQESVEKKRMRRLVYSTALLIVLAASISSCKEKVTAQSKGICFDTLRVDTTALLSDSSKAHCSLHLNLIFLAGKEYEGVNDSVLRSGLLAPEYLSLSSYKMTPAEAVDSFINRYISDYRSFYTSVYNEEADDSVATIRYSVDAELRDGRSGITNYIAHVQCDLGAGSTAYTQVLNIDIVHDRVLRLEHVFLDGYEQELGDIIAQRLCKQMKVKNLDALQRIGYFVQCTPYATTNFEMGDRSIRFYYITGEIADRDKGETVVTVPYSALKRLMRR